MDLARRVASANRRVLALLAPCLVAAVAYLAAYWLRFDFHVPVPYRTLALYSLPLVVAVRCACARGFGLGEGRWRFTGHHDLIRLVLASLTGSVALFALALVPVWTPSIPRSILVLDLLLTILFTASLWLGYRAGFELLHRTPPGGGSGRHRRVLVIGAGEAGYLLVQKMARAGLGYRPVGFVDDDPLKWNTRIHGLPVIGSVDDLLPISRAVRADELVIAIPFMSPGELRRIVELCEATDLDFRVLPGIQEVFSGQIELSQLRPVRIEDLLGRAPVELDLPELETDLRGRSVLITGAAGSIGSELSRQIAKHCPERLILFDQAETPLFQLEFELRELHPGLRITPVIGSVVDAVAVDRVFHDHAPSRVFHAAAYKHVPMMEANAHEALRNNVFGTYRVATAAGTHGAGKFVLVSTDKAVRPVSVMGATKRIAELTVLALQNTFSGTAYAAVRFGNVLGSNGSVVPIFERQIREGRPLTVTHPDATRYFMTIPEAVQLILQASLLPELRGRVAMLDMGEPVRIVDLARNLLRLSGLRSRVDERIVFTGLRPGERLHEELVGPEETTVATPIPKVRLVGSPRVAHPDLLDLIRKWGDGRDLWEEQALLRLLSLDEPHMTKQGLKSPGHWSGRLPVEKGA